METKIKTIRLGMVNCYLLTNANCSILVDTGGPNQLEALCKRIQGKNISLILLTHGHADHTANAAELSRKLGAPVAMHEADADLMQDNSIRSIYADTFIGRFIKRMSTGMLKNYRSVPFPFISLREGDQLQEYGFDVRIVELPGHTRGSVGILTKDGSLIAGDAMFNLFRPFRARLFEEKQLMLESAEKMKASGVKIIYPGHGKPFMADRIKNIN